MPVGWGICPMKVATVDGQQFRYCAIADFDAQIRADGGSWAYAETLGDHGIVKAVASAATLLAIDATPGFVRIPRRTMLTESLADLTAGEKTAIRDKLVALGYTLAEINAALGPDLGSRTMRDLMRFCVSRWRQPASIVDGVTVFEGTDWPRAPRPVESVEEAVA